MTNQIKPIAASPMSRRGFLGMIGGAALVLAACGGGSAPSSGSAASSSAVGKSGGTLIVAASAEASSLDANNTSDANSRRAAEQVTETLVRESPDGSGFVPWLADKWDISADGLTYTFTLRSGVKFHDGTPFDAAAVKFGLERQIREDHPNNKDGVWSVSRSFAMSALITAIEAVNPTTVKMT